MQSSKIRQNVQITRANWIWTEVDADVELIEPEIKVTTNCNVIHFGNKGSRPQQTASFVLSNHGKHPVAFKVLCSDNYAYFFSKNYGVIQPKEIFAATFILGKATAEITVSRRPADCFKSTYEFKSQQKDRIFIQLAPIFGWSTPPETVFHRANFYEKLKISIVYNPKFGDSLQAETLLRKHQIGWSTFQTKDEWKLEVEKRKQEKLLKKQLNEQNLGK